MEIHLWFNMSNCICHTEQNMWQIRSPINYAECDLHLESGGLVVTNHNHSSSDEMHSFGEGSISDNLLLSSLELCLSID